MKKIIKEGTFVDFKGLERNYTICAVIQGTSHVCTYLGLPSLTPNNHLV